MMPGTMGAMTPAVRHRSRKRRYVAVVADRQSAFPGSEGRVVGLRGGLAAWFGFSMPSALALIVFAYGVGVLGDLNHAAWLHGLKIVAVAVVAQAVWGMARNLCPDRERATLAIGTAILALAVPSAVGQVGAIAIGAVTGWRLLGGSANRSDAVLGFTLSRPVAIGALVAFGVLPIGLQVASATGNHFIQ